jgi:hypothetical protein
MHVKFKFSYLTKELIAPMQNCFIAVFVDAATDVPDAPRKWEYGYGGGSHGKPGGHELGCTT